MRPTTAPLLPLLLADVPASLTTMLAQDGVPTAPYQPGRTNGTFVLFDSRSRRTPTQLTARQQALDVDVVRRALAKRGVSTDAFAPLEAAGSRRAAWDVGPWQPSEEIAAVDRRSVREQVIDALRAEVVDRGGVWMRVGRFPRPYRTAANFRFDHDDYIAADFARTLAAIRGHEGMTTHFVCGATHEPHGDALRKLVGLDVGSHGYRHHTYRTTVENQANIARGIAVLRRHGLEPSGFVAPHGRYNAGLATALAALGITHSSEFSLAYDDLPFFPAGSDTLQLPIHPVCLGIVLEAAKEVGDDTAAQARGAVEATAEHFTKVAAALHAARMPIFFYGHPDGRVGRYPELLTRVLSAIDELPDVWRTTMTEFQRWWRARARIEIEVERDGAGWLVSADQLPTDFTAALEICDGTRIAAVTLDRARLRVEHKTLSFVVDEPYRAPVPTPVAKPFDLKAAIRRALDWELVTPIEEIDSGRFSGLMKKTLRRIKS